MKKLVIEENEAGQRLDRFLRKYLSGASLSRIYKIIRKDIKVNGIRVGNETMLEKNDEITIYLNDEELAALAPEKKARSPVRRNFLIIYEDQNILIANKPVGLLVHGDSFEKKNTLVNQVIDYLIEKQEYVPRLERSFSPAAVNRLDRNTSGLVIFGKNSASLRTLNQMLRERNQIGKYYLTIIAGNLKEDLRLTGSLTKNESKNQVSIKEESQNEGSRKNDVSINEETGNETRSENTGSIDENGNIDRTNAKYIETNVHPLLQSEKFTLAEVRLVTGRTHQIRAHLAARGFPVIGDAKYGNNRINKYIQQTFAWNNQFLHAYKLTFDCVTGELEYLTGRTFKADLPTESKKLVSAMFPDFKL